MGYPGKNHKSYQTPKRPFEKTRIESRVRVLYTERFHLALFPAGILLLLESALLATRLRRIP